MYILRLRYEFISIIRRASVFTVLVYANSLRFTSIFQFLFHYISNCVYVSKNQLYSPIMHC